MTCPHCGCALPENARRCPACRQRVPRAGARTSPARLRLVIALVLLAAAAAISGGMLWRARTHTPVKPPVNARPLAPSAVPADPASTNPAPKPGATETPLVDLSDPDPVAPPPKIGPAKPADLFAAVKKGDTTTVERLLATAPKLVKSVNGKGATPLHLAASTGSVALVKLLMAKGAPVNAVCNGTVLRGQTPLHVAVARDDTLVMRALLDAGANVNAPDALKSTPLHEAVLRGKVKAVALLLQRKAKIDARQKNGYTPLFWAIEENRLEIARLLLNKGADANARTPDGMSVLLFAEAVGGRDAMIALLKEHGATE